MKKVTLELALNSARECSGVNAPDLRSLNRDNVLKMRQEFLLNVAYNGKRTHRDIINVLEYMDQFCQEPVEPLWV